MTDLHILMIVSNPVSFDPRVMNEAETLVRHGYRVTIIGWDRQGQFLTEEEINGIRVLRLRNTQYMELLRWDLFRLRPWWRIAYRRAMEISRKDPFQAVHSHDLDTLPTGIRLKRKLGIPLVYDAHEIWGYMVSRDLPDFLARYYLRKERRLIHHADAVITVGDTLERYFEELTSAPIVLVLNAKRIVTRSYVPPRNKSFVLNYIGTLNNARFVKELVDAVGDLQGTELVLGGTGKPGYVRALQEKCSKVPNVTFLGKVPQEEVLPLTMEADAVVSLTDPSDKNNSIGVGNKVFEAMACGRPIIVSEGTYQAEFTEKLGTGLAVEHSFRGVKKGIEDLRDSPELRVSLGRRALEKALGGLNWTHQEKALVGVYQNLL